MGFDQRNENKGWYRVVALIVLGLLTICLVSCGEDYAAESQESSSNTGSYAFSLKWPSGTATLGSSSTPSRAVNCDAEGIDTIVAALYDSDSRILNYPPDEFICTEHSGSVKGLPPGSNYRLLVTGEDSSGTVLFEGVDTGISIAAGKTTQGDEVQMTVVVVPTCTDSDSDTYYAESGCGTPVDCNDGVDTIYPGASEIPNDGIDQDCDGSDYTLTTPSTWFRDNDNDGYGDPSDSTDSVTQPAGYVLDNTDCDDSDVNEHPGQIWHEDSDEDSYGNNSVSQTVCERPTGYVLDNTDCNDSDTDEYPGRVWYNDSDEDNYGNAAVSLTQCLRPVGYVLDNTDCNDSNSDEQPNQVWYQDLDSDGFGNAGVGLPTCEQPAGYVLSGADCNDNDVNEHPDQTWYLDADGDGYSDGTTDTSSCSRPTNYYVAFELTAISTDCDDSHWDVNPGVNEVCNDYKDNDCDEDTDCDDTDCNGEAACEYTNSLSMTFNIIPAGTFTMGSPDGVSEYPIGSGEIPTEEEGRVSDEIPHQVTLTYSYYMQTTEVTQSQWETVMGSNPSFFTSCGGDCPVEQVSWEDIRIFLATLNGMVDGTYRLPTEAEWEYSARAGSTTAFTNGHITEIGCAYDPNLDSIGWYCYNSDVAYSECQNLSLYGGPICAGTHPVAQKDSNNWGIYDMHGNVWEWVQDWGGSYPSGSATDPPGPSSGTERVIRGGSLGIPASGCRSAFRTEENPTTMSKFFGFRLVYEPSYINSLGMTFNLIPAGIFTMGSPDGVSEYPIGSGETPAAELGRGSDEPPHQVTLTQPFYMQTTEVTQGQWESLMKSNPSTLIACGTNCPVETVSWNDVQTFISILNEKEEENYRLPTEAEWEYAARSGSITSLSNGDLIDNGCDYDVNLDEMGWYCYNAEVSYGGCYDLSGTGGPSCAGIHPVVQKPANAWGLYDMHGNVYEWCQDWYDSYPVGPVVDPSGPQAGTLRILRGGGFSWVAGVCRSAARGSAIPDSGTYLYGFRLVKEP